MRIPSGRALYTTITLHAQVSPLYFKVHHAYEKTSHLSHQPNKTSIFHIVTQSGLIDVILFPVKTFL